MKNPSESVVMVKDTTIQIRLMSDRKDEWKKYIKEKGFESTTDFIIAAVEFYMENAETQKRILEKLKMIEDK